MPRHKVTLRDIAERLSLSRMAVSMALRGAPGIGPETRARVREVARELGFRPDPEVSRAMQALRRASHQRNPAIVSLITHGPDDEWMRAPALREYAAGIRERADELGFDVRIFGRRSEGMNDRRLSNILRARGIENMIIAPLPPHRVGERIDFAWDQFTAITLGHSIDWLPIHRACANHFESAITAYAAMVARGYRRIGLALSREHDGRTGGRWHGGFLTAQSRHGFDPVPVLIADAWTPACFLAWLRETGPDAIIVQGPDPLRWLREASLKIPRDVAVASTSVLDGIAGHSDAGIRDPLEAIGAAAVNLVAGESAGRARGIPRFPRTVEISGRWVDGSMLPAKPRSARRRGAASRI